MKSRLWLFLCLTFSLSACQAQESCDQRRPVKTPVGDLIETQCTDSKGVTTRSFVTVGGTKVLEDKALFEADQNKSRSIWVYTGKAEWTTGCPSQLFLIDLQQQPFKTIAFGVKKACNQFQSASWGEKRSVLSLKNNVKFIYENGKMTLPASGEKLWKTIEPPHAGAGLDLQDAVAFFENVPLPK